MQQKFSFQLKEEGNGKNKNNFCSTKE